MCYPTFKMGNVKCRTLYLFLFHGNVVNADEPTCYVIRTLLVSLLHKSGRTSVHVITIFHVTFIINSSYFPIHYYRLGVSNRDAICFVRSRSCIVLVQVNITLQTVEIDDHGDLCSDSPYILITAYMLCAPPILFSSIWFSKYLLQKINRGVCLNIIFPTSLASS
jgi:hypothetical protein